MGRRAKCLNLHIPVKNYIRGVSAPRVLCKQPPPVHNYTKTEGHQNDSDAALVTSFYDVMAQPRPSAHCIWNAFLHKHTRQFIQADDDDIEVTEVGRPNERSELRVQFVCLYILPLELVYLEDSGSGDIVTYDAIALYEAVEL